MHRSSLAAVVFATVLLSPVLESNAQVRSTRQPAKPTPVFGHKSVDQAWGAAVKGRKPLLVMFTSEHCIYCKKMLKETYAHPTIQRMLLGNSESVLAHADQYPELVKKLGIRGFPTTMLVSPEGKVLDLLPGYVEPKAFSQRIHPLLFKSGSRASESSVVVNQPK